MRTVEQIRAGIKRDMKTEITIEQLEARIAQRIRNGDKSACIADSLGITRQDVTDLYRSYNKKKIKPFRSCMGTDEKPCAVDLSKRLSTCKRCKPCAKRQVQLQTNKSVVRRRQKVRIARLLLEGKTIPNIAEAEGVSIGTSKALIVKYFPVKADVPKKEVRAERLKIARNHLESRGIDMSYIDESEPKPIVKAKRGCGYNIVDTSGAEFKIHVCGKSIVSGNYCAAHYDKTHPAGAGQFAKIMSARLPVRELTP